MAVVPLSELDVYGLDIGDLPSTEHFVRKYHHLLEFHIRFELRKGAPVLQMLKAPVDFVEGSTEPWVVGVLKALIIANDARVVMETGSFLGQTSEHLAMALESQEGGKLILCEIDPDRAQATHSRLSALWVPDVDWKVHQQDVMTVIYAQPDASLDFVFVDDEHSKEHVTAEIEALWPKMKLNGLICGHDVHGICDLQEVFKKFGGYALDLPRLGPAGGLGILQVRG